MNFIYTLSFNKFNYVKSIRQRWNKYNFLHIRSFTRIAFVIPIPWDFNYKFQSKLNWIIEAVYFI